MILTYGTGLRKTVENAAESSVKLIIMKLIVSKLTVWIAPGCKSKLSKGIIPADQNYLTEYRSY